MNFFFFYFPCSFVFLFFYLHRPAVALKRAYLLRVLGVDRCFGIYVLLGYWIKGVSLRWRWFVSRRYHHIGLRLGFAVIVDAYGQVLNGADDMGTIPVAHYY